MTDSGPPRTAVGSYKIYIDDPQAGEVAYYGVISEDGHPSIFGVRLKVVHHEVSEIETFVARRDQPNSAFGDPDNLEREAGLLVKTFPRTSSFPARS